jgi:Nis1 family
LTSVQQVALVIGISPCQNGQCVSPDEALDNLLYSGSFIPQFHEAGPGPYQNFSVQIPDTISSGAALVGVAHFALVGVSSNHVRVLQGYALYLLLTTTDFISRKKDEYGPLIDYHNQSVTIA